MRWVQIISRKGQWEANPARFEIKISTVRVLGRARLQSCRNGGKISRALAPEVELLIPLESSETICQIPTQIGKDIVRTAWRHAESGRNVHSAWFGESPSAAKAVERVTPNGTIEIVPYPKSRSRDWLGGRNKVERNSLSGKFRPARMA